MSDVMNVRVLMNLRIKYNITAREIANEAGTTQQWISKIELNLASASDHNKELVLGALERIIQKRKLEAQALEEELNEIKEHILEEEPEWINL